jgi:hypothetical protein
MRGAQVYNLYSPSHLPILFTKSLSLVQLQLHQKI